MPIDLWSLWRVRWGWNVFRPFFPDRFGIGRIDNFVGLVFKDGPLRNVLIRSVESGPGIRTTRAHAGHPLQPRSLEHGAGASVRWILRVWGQAKGRI